MKKAIEQAEKQEPVAFASHGVVNWIADKQFQHEADLYTTPQQREWVGLTDEEIALVCGECAASAHNWNDISFARAIEAKLKERNHG
jgi:hypothetical protein